MTNALTYVFSLIAGMTLVVNGMSVDVDELLDHTKDTVNQANVHQLATVLELYHLNHGTYPEVEGGEALIELLGSEEYIRNRPLDPSVFAYSTERNGQEYRLEVTK